MTSAENFLILYDIFSLLIFSVTIIFQKLSFAWAAGLRKIIGAYYVDGFEVPRRSWQSLWRAAVEMSKNASQLALQVCPYILRKIHV